MRRRTLTLVAVAALMSLSAGSSLAEVTGDPPGHGMTGQSGTVLSGDTPVPSAEVSVYQAGDEKGSAPRRLARTRSDGRGRFHVAYRRPDDPSAVLYLTADSGRPPRRGTGAHRTPPVRLVTVLGTAREHRGGTGKVVLNERTTVAAGFALAQFTEGAEVSGPHPGLQNAAAVAHNLADITTGKVAKTLSTPPNGDRTSALRTFNSLSDILAGCTEGRTCDELFRLARRPGQPAPRDTFQAAADIARAPGHDVAALFALSSAAPRYRPALRSAPDAWTIALRYVGNGHELDGPGNIAFDAQGNAWIPNNYVYDPDPRNTACGSRVLSKLTPTGRSAPGAPFSGGGLYGAGFGIAQDPRGSVWVGNFGFQGTGCALDADRLYRSVSQFAPDGRALSPRRGWRQGDILQPQGLATDRRGNVWVANCGGRSVTRIPHGRPEGARNIAPGGDSLVKPFGIAVDTSGRAWVTGNGSDNVTMLSPTGEPRRTVSGGGIKRPMGVATDSLGNVWVSNGGAVVAPCEGTTPAMLAEAVAQIVTRHVDASVTMIRSDGTTPARPFVNDGLFLPWGIAVDGSDNVWVANFGGHRIAHLCGARTSACPPGVRTGDPISPADTGYTSDGLDRNTGIQVDPSGNVWLANNWRTVPVQTNPGGHEMVVFIGVATPVRTPLIGAPRPF
ncbi:NHL repeat-containing protein [Streptomyces sp. NPDC048577]|uniref:NHL repeat-containing protein n=1 Tax=Streptomyces sp. NPDC048577 TaxID=3157209 RepID=UPI0034498F35